MRKREVAEFVDRPTAICLFLALWAFCVAGFAVAVVAWLIKLAVI